MTTAREKFKLGQRVRMTRAALDQNMDGVYVKRGTGVVKGFLVRAEVTDPALLVKVLRDGDKAAKRYHIDFWEPDE